MTRILAELLGQPEQAFRASLLRLERANGHLSHDVRLTAEVVQKTQQKLRQLNLDPHDTSGPELYAALIERLRRDERRLRIHLASAMSGPDDALSGIAHALQQLPLNGTCFALRPTAAKALLKKQPPKKAMKRLGYRSFDSMLKHEPVAAIFAVAWSVEAASWRKNFTKQYGMLKPSDFETRGITVIHPRSAKWAALGAELVRQHRHSVLTFKELGAVIILPLAKTEQPPAFAMVTLLTALQAMNDIRGVSSYLRLRQLGPDFGTAVLHATYGEPQLQSNTLDQPVAWPVIQRFVSRASQVLDDELFELPLQRQDIQWHPVERMIAYLEPALQFWHGTGHLGLLANRQAVSLNVFDVALGVCNQLPFERRLVHHFRGNLNQEIVLRYLQPETVRSLIQAQWEPALEPAIADM